LTELGLGVSRDPAKAIAFYKQAAARGEVQAEVRLGEIYLKGDLVSPDFSLAKSYLDKAAYHQPTGCDKFTLRISRRNPTSYVTGRWLLSMCKPRSVA
jgi:TPR repeat protein